MKQPHPILRIIAVLSSVLLVAGCVSYRAGGLTWFKKQNDEAAQSKDKSAPVIFDTTKFSNGVPLRPTGLLPTVPDPKPSDDKPTVPRS